LGAIYPLLFVLLATPLLPLQAAEVHPSSGALRASATDIELATPLSRVPITRQYSSAAGKGEFGPGWRMEFATRLEMAGGEKIVLHAPGGSQVFRRSGKDEYLGPAGQRLIRDAQSSLLTTREGAIIRFDVDGKEVSRQDAHGNKLASFHDSHGRLVRLSAGQQNEIHFKFRPDGRLVALEGRAGRKIEYAYDERSRLSRVRNVDGWTTDYHYGDKDLLTGITHADGSSESFVYDGQGRVVERRGPAGLVERYSYQGATLHVLGGPKGGWAQGHDAEGRPLWREDATGRRETWTWSEDGQLLGRRYADGSLLNLAYDDQGRLISQESSTGRRLRFTYDSRGRLQGLDSNGAVTRYQYDERGNVTAVTSPAGRSIRFEHDARGRPTRGRRGRARDASGIRRTGQVDPAGGARWRRHALGIRRPGPAAAPGGCVGRSLRPTSTRPTGCWPGCWYRASRKHASSTTSKAAWWLRSKVANAPNMAMT
jgi:YD repeat-containing protein